MITFSDRAARSIALRWSPGCLHLYIWSSGDMNRDTIAQDGLWMSAYGPLEIWIETCSLKFRCCHISMSLSRRVTCHVFSQADTKQWHVARPLLTCCSPSVNWAQLPESHTGDITPDHTWTNSQTQHTDLQIYWRYGASSWVYETIE